MSFHSCTFQYAFLGILTKMPLAYLTKPMPSVFRTEAVLQQCLCAALFLSTHLLIGSLKSPFFHLCTSSCRMFQIPDILGLSVSFLVSFSLFLCPIAYKWKLVLEA